MSFGQAIGSFFKNYVNFRGRARRSEFWFAYLFIVLVSTVLGGIMGAVAGAESSTGVAIMTVIMAIWELAIIIPSLSLQIRRLHDMGNHWYSIFLYLIPIAEIVFFFIFNCTDSKPDNEWGPNPKQPGQQQFYQPGQQ